MSLLDFFRRGSRKGLPRNWEDSPEHWMPGDIAICIRNNGQWANACGVHCDGPVYNESFSVRIVAVVEGRQFLMFDRFPGNFYLSSGFTKGRPDEAKGSRKAWADLVRKHRAKVLA